MPSVKAKFPNGVVSFSHPPKCAGTSIGTWLTNHADLTLVNSYEHPTAAMMGNDADFTFSVIRNPWDAVVSFYEYMANPTSDMGRGFSRAFLSVNRIVTIPSFKFFVLNIEQVNIPLWFGKVTPQAIWHQHCNAILKYENLQEDFKVVQEFCGNFTELPVLNTTKQKDYRSYYSDLTKDKIYRVFHEDVKRGDYEF